jgi:hypothetical protein
VIKGSLEHLLDLTRDQGSLEHLLDLTRDQKLTQTSFRFELNNRLECGKIMTTFLRSNFFVLRSIDPKQLRVDYLNEEYASSTIPPSRIKASEIFYVNTPTFGCSPEEHKYQFKDQNNASMVIQTTNGQDYTVYKNKKRYAQRSRRCPWCLDDFKREPVRVPVRVQTFQTDHQSQMIFWDTGVCCCSFGCALSWANREAKDSPCYERSPRLVQLLFDLSYPSKSLVPTPPYQFHENHGGSQSESEYRKNIYQYERINNVIYLPAKEEYLQKKV